MQEASVGNVSNKSYSELNAPKFIFSICQPFVVGFSNFGDFLHRAKKRLKSVGIRQYCELNN